MARVTLGLSRPLSRARDCKQRHTADQHSDTQGRSEKDLPPNEVPLRSLEGFEGRAK